MNDYVIVNMSDGQYATLGAPAYTYLIHKAARFKSKQAALNAALPSEQVRSVHELHKEGPVIDL